MTDNRAQLLITAVDQTRGTFDSIKRNLGGLLDAARFLNGLLANLGVAVSAAGLGAMLKSSLESADALSKLSQRVGITVESLSTLIPTEDLSGVSAEKFEGGLRKLATRMLEAATGTEDAARGFAAIGVAFQNQDGTPTRCCSTWPTASRRCPTAPRRRRSRSRSSASRARILEPVRILWGIDKPTVARLHGDAVGGGLGLALACDFRIASAGARLGAPFVRIGLAGCDMSAGYFLPRLVGLGRAADLMMTGRLVDAAEAAAIGLVTRVVPEGDLDEAVSDLARSLAEGAPRALAFTKGAIRRSLDRPMEAEFDYEVFAQVQCLQSEDHREGIAALREKRRAVFRGR